MNSYSLVYMACVALLAASGERVLYMEPPDCEYNVTLDDREVIFVESSNRSHIQNQMGECTAQLQNRNKSRHLKFSFEIGKYTSKCACKSK